MTFQLGLFPRLCCRCFHFSFLFRAEYLSFKCSFLKIMDSLEKIALHILYYRMLWLNLNILFYLSRSYPLRRRISRRISRLAILFHATKKPKFDSACSASFLFFYFLKKTLFICLIWNCNLPFNFQVWGNIFSHKFFN